MFIDDDGLAYSNAPYIAWLPDGTTKKGMTDTAGNTEVFYSNDGENVVVHLLN